jgi:hypothetical protein
MVDSMRKYVIFTLLTILFASNAYAASPADMLLMVTNKKSSGGTTDYTADVNCMGSWPFKVAGGSDEPDTSGEGGTLLESSGETLARTANVPSGYSGYSRECEVANTEYFYHADGNSTDISGANQSITIAAWVYRNTDTAGDEVIAGKWSDASSYRQYKVVIAGGDSDQIEFYLNHDCGSANTVIATGATSLAATTWYHVAAVYNDTDMRVYINGSLDSNGADNPKSNTAGICAGSGTFYVCRDHNDRYFNGDIDELIVFDKALSASEVSDLYNDGMDGTKGGND